MKQISERVRNLLAYRERLFVAGGKKLAVAGGVLAGIVLLIALSYAHFFGPAGTRIAESEFIVSPGTTLQDVAKALKDQGFVKSDLAFQIAYAFERGEDTIRPGGYKIAPSMDTRTVSKILSTAPYLAWVEVPNGLRQEEVGEFLAHALGWTEEELAEWTLAHTDPVLDAGLYLPDTYLIPSDQAPRDVAARLRGRFEDAFAPYAVRANEKGIPPSELLVLASLVEREAAKNDKPLVAGILWNRLNRGMLLQVDATLQYAKGTPGNWWPQPQSEDKYIESPFNTYENKGLPPKPIASPSLASIEAVLFPTATKCLYYLHDANGRIHCSTTYSQHVANVQRYLR